MQGKHPHSVHSYSFIAFGPVQKSLELNIAFLEKLDFRTRVANATHNFAKSRLKLTIEDLIRVTLIVFDAWRLVWRGLIDSVTLVRTMTTMVEVMRIERKTMMKRVMIGVRFS